MLLSCSLVQDCDAFYGVLPAYCIRNNMSMLSAIALQFLSGVFPILVVFMTYVTIELHSKSFRPVVVLLHEAIQPMLHPISKTNESKDLSNGRLFINYFVSFTKFIVISCMLHVLAHNWMTSSQTYVTYLYDGTVKYFENDYILYVSLSI